MRIGLWLALWRARRPYAREWEGGPLIVLPGVLDPVGTKVGEWLARQVAAEARPGQTWLDLGCGTGVVGLALAAKGCRVTCADVDPEALRNTRANAALLGLDVEVVETDLFDGLRGRRFDRLVSNPPFWPGDPAGKPFGRAMYAGPDFALLRRLVAGWRDVADEARVVLSEAGPASAGARAALGTDARLLCREKHRGEWLALYALGTGLPVHPDTARR